MKSTLFVLLLLFVSAPSFAQDVAYLSSDENNMVRDINLVRTHPQDFIPLVKTYLEEMKKWQGTDIEQIMADGQNLIDELGSLKPVGLLQPLECLENLAKAHGEVCMTEGKLRHNLDLPNQYQTSCGHLVGIGENITAGDTNPRNALILLLISPDEAPIHYGHRHNILDPNWTHVGVVNAGKIGTMAANWIQDFSE